MLGTTDGEGETSQTSSVYLPGDQMDYAERKTGEECDGGMRGERGDLLYPVPSLPPWSLVVSCPPQLPWLFFLQVWVDSLGAYPPPAG